MLRSIWRHHISYATLSPWSTSKCLERQKSVFRTAQFIFYMEVELATRIDK